MRNYQRDRRARLKEESLQKGVKKYVKIVKNINIPSTVKTGITTDVSVLRAFHLFLLKKHHRGPKKDLIDNLIVALEKLK